MAEITACFPRHSCAAHALLSVPPEVKNTSEGSAFISCATAARAVRCALRAAPAALYAAVMILNRRITGVKSEDRTVVQLSVSALVVLVYVLLTQTQAAFALTAVQGALLIVVGVVHTGIAYLCYFGALRDLPAQNAAILSYLDPAVALLVSALVLGEKLGLHGWIGAVLILGGALVSELNKNE